LNGLAPWNLWKSSENRVKRHLPGGSYRIPLVQGFTFNVNEERRRSAPNAETLNDRRRPRALYKGNHSRAPPRTGSDVETLLGQY
jgi:hypothetical protein